MFTRKRAIKKIRIILWDGPTEVVQNIRPTEFDEISEGQFFPIFNTNSVVYSSMPFELSYERNIY